MNPPKDIADLMVCTGFLCLLGLCLNKCLLMGGLYYFTLVKTVLLKFTGLVL